jgi:uncharacterized protein YlxW (UPF0749 family)
MNIFTTGFRHQPWVWQVTALCFLLGALLAGSIKTVSNVNRSGVASTRVGVPPPAYAGRISQFQQLQNQITDLNREKEHLLSSLSKGDDQSKTLNDELKKVNMLAGFSAVHGPGVVLFLQDSQKRPPSYRAFDADKYIIHDVDLQQVVNELGASGAEAISINNQRIIARTSIRCVGPTIQVNGIPIVPPFEIHAIGDPDTLAGGLNLPYGVLDGIRRYDPNMYRLEKRKDILVPAFAGNTEMRYSKPVPDRDRSGKE